MNRKWVRALMFLVPLAIGVGVVGFLVRSKPGAVEVAQVERKRVVRTIRAEKREVVPRALGYGTAQPGRVWRAVAQVPGRVVEKNPRLEAGTLLPEGTLLLRIDPQEYILAAAELEANLAKIDADLAALATREENTQASLAIERKSLAVADAELKRLEGLLDRGAAPISDVDRQRSAYFAQLARVQELENGLRVVPVDRQSLEANRKSSEAKLASARLDLSFTEIRAPFDCRIAEVEFEETQYVGVGQVLVEAHGLAVAEVVAQIPIARARHLLPVLETDAGLLGQILSGELIERLQLGAVVRLRFDDEWIEWDARVARVRGTLDAATRTLGIVVAVDKPYEKARPGLRPPLIRGMFCEVELRGPPKPGLVLVPRTALHDGEVYVVEDERLRRRPVRVAFPIQDFVCIAEGLAGGETVVVSDPIPAFDGMLLETRADEELAARLAAVAAGEAPLR